MCLSYVSVSLLFNSLTSSPHLSTCLYIWYIQNSHSLYFYVFVSLSSVYLFYLSLNFPLRSPSSTVSFPSHTDHIHMLIIKSPPAPPHLWGNPLAGHLCLSDKEQYACFILTLLFLPLWLFLYDFHTTAYVGSRNLDWPYWNRCGLCVIPPATAVAFNEPQPD